MTEEKGSSGASTTKSDEGARSEKQGRPKLEDLPQVTTVKEVAPCLRVSRKTLYRMIKDGELPARRIGSCIRLHRDTIIEWLQGGQ